MNGLRLSKVPSRPNTIRPPLGALGFAYGICLKSADRAGAPCIAMPRAGRPIGEVDDWAAVSAFVLALKKVRATITKAQRRRAGPCRKGWPWRSRRKVPNGLFDSADRTLKPNTDVCWTED